MQIDHYRLADNQEPMRIVVKEKATWLEKFLFGVPYRLAMLEFDGVEWWDVDSGQRLKPADQLRVVLCIMRSTLVVEPAPF